MADKFKHGWVTVVEYLEDELVNNSNDEKRMQKAEYRGGRKVKAAATKYSKKKYGTMQKRPEQVSGIATSYFPQPFNQLQMSDAVPVMTLQHVISYPKWSGQSRPSKHCDFNCITS